MRYVSFFFAVFLLLIGTVPAHAQDGASCEPQDFATATLDVNNVHAPLFTDGRLFYSGYKNYEVPKGTEKESLLAAHIWMGGYIEDSLRVSGATYGLFQYRPGPLSEDGTPAADCTPFNRLWSVSRTDIAHYEATGELTDDLRDWPVALGAPVIDGDGDPDNYNLAAGDRPAIRGDQGIWWVMNDVAAPRTYNPEPRRRRDTLPIGMEVQVLAYAFDDDRTLNNTTFYDYTLVYRGEAPLTETYVGAWSDPDLGYAYDDLVGSDTTLGMVYVYNESAFDEGERGVFGKPGYGYRVPALGFVLLDSPTGDDGTPLGMTGALALYKSGRTNGVYFLNDPDYPVQFYDYMRGYNDADTPVTFGGPGIGFSDTPTTYMFTGEPGFFWSEENNGSETRYKGDKRMLLSSGPFTMQPGETQRFHFAVVWSQAREGATNPRLDSVRLLKRDVRRILPPTSTATDASADVPAAFALRGNYPNPFNPATNIVFDLPEAASVAVSVYDVLGREVLTLPAQQMQSGAAQSVEVEAGALPSGMYVYRVAVESAAGLRQATGRMIVVK